MRTKKEIKSMLIDVEQDLEKCNEEEKEMYFAICQTLRWVLDIPTRIPPRTPREIITEN